MVTATTDVLRNFILWKLVKEDHVKETSRNHLSEDEPSKHGNEKNKSSWRGLFDRLEK